jgi:DNA recombination protein RmuC
MDIAALLVVSFLGVITTIGFIFLLRKLESFKKDQTQDQSIVLLQKQISDLTRDMNERLTEQNRTVSQQMKESNRVIQQQSAVSSQNILSVNKTISKITQDLTNQLSNVSERLAKVNDTNAQVIDFTKQLQSLENILKNPKQRGILGEYFLETLLGNLFPPSQYKMQYKFKDGEIVDAVIFVKEKIIPIDAKFSLENYNKLQEEQSKDKRLLLIKQFKLDLKKRIDETSKYIRMNEKTTDFAFMFIPAEGVYYNLLVYKIGDEVNSKDLIEYAFSKHVIIVSPNSFFAYLQTILQALKTLQVQESVQVIIKNVRQLQNHIAFFDQNLQKLGKHLDTTVNTYNNSYKEFKKIDKDIVHISGGKESIEPMFIDRPQNFNEE